MSMWVIALWSTWIGLWLAFGAAVGFGIVHTVLMWLDWVIELALQPIRRRLGERHYWRFRS